MVADGIYVSIEGVTVFLALLDRSYEAVEAAAFMAIEDVIKDYYEDLYKLLSATTYTLEELRKMGHPYKKGGNLSLIKHMPKEMIHHRTEGWEAGTYSMRDTLKQNTLKEIGMVFGIVGWFKQDAPDYTYPVIHGSPTMISRNIFLIAWKRKELANKFKHGIVRYYNKQMPRKGEYNKIPGGSRETAVVRSMAQGIRF